MRAVLDEFLPEFRGDFGHLHAAAFQDGLVEALLLRMWNEATAEHRGFSRPRLHLSACIILEIDAHQLAYKKL